MRREIAGSSPRYGQPSQLGSEAAFSPDQRTICSRRLSSDWISDATASRAEASCRTASIQPRDGLRTATSVNRCQRGWATCEEQLQHRGLVTVADRRAGVGVQLRAEVSAEGEGQPLVGLDGRTLVPGLDPTEIGRVNPGRRREAGAGHPGVCAELGDVGGEASRGAGRSHVRRARRTRARWAWPQSAEWPLTCDLTRPGGRPAQSRRRPARRLDRHVPVRISAVRLDHRSSGTRSRTSEPPGRVLTGPRVQARRSGAGRSRLPVHHAGRARSRREAATAGEARARAGRVGARRRRDRGMRAARAAEERCGSVVASLARVRLHSAHPSRDGLIGVGSLGLLPGSQPQPHRRRRDGGWTPRQRAPARPRAPGRIPPRPYSLAPGRP